MNPKYNHIGKSDDRIIEECSELILAISKAKRFGWNNYHPDNPEISNRQRVMLELEDVITCINTFVGEQYKNPIT